MIPVSHIAGNPERLTAMQRELIETAARLGREKFAPRAMQIDRDAVFPFDNYHDLREAGLLKICVPTAYGGLGADFATYVMVAAEVGRHCGATALTWNMHVSSTRGSGRAAAAHEVDDGVVEDLRLLDQGEVAGARDQRELRVGDLVGHHAQHVRRRRCRPSRCPRCASPPNTTRSRRRTCCA